MAPRTNACDCIRHFKQAPFSYRNDLHIYTSCRDFSRHNSSPRFRRALHATPRTLESSQSSAIVRQPVSRDRLELDERRSHAFSVRKSLSFPRGARRFLSTHASRFSASEDAKESLQAKTGDADISSGDSLNAGREENTDKLGTKLSSSAINDIKTFRHIWNRGIIHVSKSLKVCEDEGHSNFIMNLRILKGVHSGGDRKLRVRGELKSTNKVRTCYPRELRLSFI
jgi:hypothetical protein